MVRNEGCITHECEYEEVDPSKESIRKVDTHQMKESRIIRLASEWSEILDTDTAE